MAERRDAAPTWWVGPISPMTILSLLVAKCWIRLPIPVACVSFFGRAKMSFAAILRVFDVVEGKFAISERNTSTSFAAMLYQYPNLFKNVSNGALSSVLEEGAAVQGACDVFC